MELEKGIYHILDGNAIVIMGAEHLMGPKTLLEDFR